MRRQQVWGLLLLISLSISSLVFAATSKQYTARETAITFQDSSGTVAINVQNMATVTGSYSAQLDRGSGSTASLYNWRGTVQMNTTGVVGETVDLYIATSDGTNTDGANNYITGTSASSLGALTSTNALKNLIYIGSVIVDVADANKTHTASGVVFIPTRYMQLVVWNGTTKTLKNTANANTFSLTPIPNEQQ